MDDNLEPNNGYIDKAEKFEPFTTNEFEIMQFFALQLENVIAETLKKYGLYFYVQASNEIADAFLKNTEKFCEGKRSEL